MNRLNRVLVNRVLNESKSKFIINHRLFKNAIFENTNIITNTKLINSNSSNGYGFNRLSYKSFTTSTSSNNNNNNNNNKSYNNDNSSSGSGKNNQLEERLKMVDSMIDHLNSSVTLEPGNFMHYLNRGSLYTFKQQFDEAINDFNKVLELTENIDLGEDASRHRAYHGLSLVQNKLGQFQKCIDIINKSQREGGFNPAQFVLKGDCLVQLKNYIGALQCYHAAYKSIDPNSTNIYTRQSAYKTSELLVECHSLILKEQSINSPTHFKEALSIINDRIPSDKMESINTKPATFDALGEKSNLLVKELENILDSIQSYHDSTKLFISSLVDLYNSISKSSLEATKLTNNPDYKALDEKVDNHLFVSFQMSLDQYFK